MSMRKNQNAIKASPWKGQTQLLRATNRVLKLSAGQVGNTLFKIFHHLLSLLPMRVFSLVKEVVQRHDWLMVFPPQHVSVNSLLNGSFSFWYGKSFQISALRKYNEELHRESLWQELKGKKDNVANNVHFRRRKRIAKYRNCCALSSRGFVQCSKYLASNLCACSITVFVGIKIC